MNTDRKDRRGQVLSLAAARADHLARSLRTKLGEYLEGDETAETVAWGLARFFPEEMFDENLEPEVLSLAIDWLAFECIPPWGSTLAYRMAMKHPSLSLSERDTLRAWAGGAKAGFFRVEQVSGREARLVRIPDGATFVARTVDAAADPGDVVMTWLLPTGPCYHFGLHVAFLANSVVDDLRHVLQVEMELLRRQKPLATWDDLYRTLWPRVIWYLFLLGNGADVTRIQAPPGPSVLWDGRPIPGAPDWWEQMALWVRSYAGSGAPGADPVADGAERLWWDAALALRPRYPRLESWLAGILYVFRRHVLGDHTVTRAEVADECGVTVSTVAYRSRQVAKALGVRPYDLRYVDLLATDVRVLWEMNCLVGFGPPVADPGLDVRRLSPESQLALHRMLRDMAKHYRE